MTFIAILFVLVAFGSLVVSLCAMLLDWDDQIVTGGMIVFLVSTLVGIGGLLIALLITGPSPIVEGACYRAVRHTTTAYIPTTVGKTTVLIPSTTSGVDLLEIRCPI